MAARLKKGLTLGKYAPFHRGHQLVLETAISEMDELVVIIYDSPEVTATPLSVRSAWIRKLYPSVKVIEAWDGPAEVGYTSEIKQAHERYIIDTLGIRDITHFYSSEPYGAHMSKALGAIDRRIDETRSQQPISASMIRQTPYKYREYLSPLIYRDLITNIAFLGAPGTGKTTVAEALANQYKTVWMSEYGREFWEKHQINRRLTSAQLVSIAEGHLEREDQQLLQANHYLFTDTNAITTFTFARYYHNTIPDRIRALAAQARFRYDLTFVCDTDISYPDTWDRSGEVNRIAFQRQVIGDLNAHKVPFILLSGSLAERIETVKNVLRQFKKYENHSIRLKEL